jgi:hypothetical protein
MALAKVLGLDATATSYLLGVAASKPTRTERAATAAILTGPASADGASGARSRAPRKR